MTRGLYAAASGAVAALERLDAVAQNLANVNTAGYKGARPVFKVKGDGDVPPDPSADVSPERQLGVAQVQQASLERDFTPGPMRQSGNALDVAIQGPGFFAVATPRGERYTRQGTFAVDGQGYLVTEHGERVQGEQGDLRLDGAPLIGEDGTITTTTGTNVGKLKLVGFGDKPALVAEGNSLFAPGPGAVAQPIKESDVRLQQGAIEASNVDAVRSLMELVEVSRGFESYMKALQRFDEIGQRSINDVGRV
jgi:flagellar basal-body rod protein FlgG